MTEPVTSSESAEIATLRRERDQAVARARELEHELGALRGRVKLLEAASFWRTAWRAVAKSAAYRAARFLKA